MNIKTLRPKPNESVVKALEQMLESAKAGDLQAIAWIAVMFGGETQNGCMSADNTDLLALLGESCLLMRSIANVIEGGE